MDFGSFAVEGPCGDALAEGFDTAHRCLESAACVVSGPLFPECPAVVARRAERFVVRLGAPVVLLLRPAVFADRDNRCAATYIDGSVAAAWLVGTVGGYGADVFFVTDLCL